MLYYLAFEYVDSDERNAPVENGFALGVFNSMERTERAIEHYKKQSGFSEYDNGFYIRLLDYPDNCDTLYSPYYSHIGKFPSEDIEGYLGFYDTIEEAQRVLETSAEKYDYLDRDDFGITEWIINKMGWTEGFDRD
ncbi:MAG: hypothetical protein IJL83_06580 [Clostridia bacterium]|nr:hypothetical protein [Clostridia bacterium]